MPTRTKPKPSDHLADARSARAVRNVVRVIGTDQYVFRRGQCYPIDHPVVLEQPDAFAPSGEAPLAGRRFRDLTPRPRTVKAEATVTATAVCAEASPCGWTVEGEPARVAHLADQHVHHVQP